MSEKAKQILVLFVGAVVIGGVITIQVWRSRPAPPVVAAPPPGSSEPAAETVPPSPADVSAGVLPAPPAGPAAGEAAAAGIVLDTDTGEWGRNPFLTVSEIAALERAEEPVRTVLEPEPPPPSVEATPALPEYNVTAILSSEHGFSAVVDSRVVRPGDRLGRETVIEITDRSIVLESAGRVREVPIERATGTTIEAPDE